jgi:hypothetical protein
MRIYQNNMKDYKMNIKKKLNNKSIKKLSFKKSIKKNLNAKISKLVY